MEPLVDITDWLKKRTFPENVEKYVDDARKRRKRGFVCGILMQLVELVGRSSTSIRRCRNMIIDHHSPFSLSSLALSARARLPLVIIDHFSSLSLSLCIFVGSLTHIVRLRLLITAEREINHHLLRVVSQSIQLTL